MRRAWLLPIALIADRGKAVPLYAEKPVFDASGFVTELKTATSKDGTPIDYYLVRSKASKSGATPLLMTGYGAFGISLAPEHLGSTVGGKALVPGLTRGGAFAVPLIRGAGSPVYYLEDQEGGHGVSDPLSRPELMADRMTFLIDTLMPE